MRRRAGTAGRMRRRAAGYRTRRRSRRNTSGAGAVCARCQRRCRCAACGTGTLLCGARPDATRTFRRCGAVLRGDDACLSGSDRTVSQSRHHPYPPGPHRRCRARAARRPRTRSAQCAGLQSARLAIAKRAVSPRHARRTNRRSPSIPPILDARFNLAVLYDLYLQQPEQALINYELYRRAGGEQGCHAGALDRRPAPAGDDARGAAGGGS